ncbi:hypothetical protein Tco_0234355 [Tanacetum coccineum]
MPCDSALAGCDNFGCDLGYHSRLFEVDCSEEVEGNKDECEENKGNEEQQETYGESNEDESQNEAEHNKSENINNIGNLSLSVGQNTTVNAPVESIVNATVEPTVNVVAVLP